MRLPGRRRRWRPRAWAGALVAVAAVATTTGAEDPDPARPAGHELSFASRYGPDDPRERVPLAGAEEAWRVLGGVRADPRRPALWPEAPRPALVARDDGGRALELRARRGLGSCVEVPLRLPFDGGPGWALVLRLRGRGVDGRGTLRTEVLCHAAAPDGAPAGGAPGPSGDARVSGGASGAGRAGAPGSGAVLALLRFPAATVRAGGGVRIAAGCAVPEGVRRAVLRLRLRAGDGTARTSVEVARLRVGLRVAPRWTWGPRSGGPPLVLEGDPLRVTLAWPGAAPGRWRVGWEIVPAVPSRAGSVRRRGDARPFATGADVRPVLPGDPLRLRIHARVPLAPGPYVLRVRREAVEGAPPEPPGDGGERAEAVADGDGDDDGVPDDGGAPLATRFVVLPLSPHASRAAWARLVPWLEGRELDAVRWLRGAPVESPDGTRRPRALEVDFRDRARAGRGVRLVVTTGPAARVRLPPDTGREGRDLLTGEVRPGRELPSGGLEVEARAGPVVHPFGPPGRSP